MSRVPHTPGPWAVAYLDNNGQPVVKAEHTEVATCWHHCVESLEVQAHANARLIAAAPELLEACVGLVRLIDENPDADLADLMKVWRLSSDGEPLTRAAIAKATGDA